MGVTGPECPVVDAAVKRRRVRLIVTLVLIGTVAAIGYHYVQAYYWGHPFPLSTFLFSPADHFGDWYKTWGFASNFAAGGFAAPFPYFPLGYLAIVATTPFPPRVGFYLMVGAFLLVMALVLWKWVADAEEDRYQRLQSVFILMALSYPVLFALDRGNIDLLLFVMVAGFFYFAYVRRSLWVAAVLLGAVIAFKLYPATLLLIPLAERRFKLTAATIAAAAVFTVAATLALAAMPWHTIPQVIHMCLAEKGGYQDFAVQQGNGLAHGHSLWGIVSLVSILRDAPLQHWESTAYTVTTAIVFLVIAVYVVLWERETWKRVLLAVLPLVLLPFVSADYTLLYLYFPLIFFVNARRVSRWDPVYAVLFAVLLVPVAYHYLSTDYGGISVSVVVYPLAMVLLAVLAVADRAPRGSSGARDLSAGVAGDTGASVAAAQRR